MQKKTILIICITAIILMFTSGCVDFKQPSSTNSTNTTTDKASDEDSDSTETAESSSQADTTSSESESDEVDTSDRTPATDRKEIENNFRDAKELIELGEYDDALMIIKSLKTRDLTDAEKEKLAELEKELDTLK